MPNPIDSPEYWIEDYKPSSKELDFLYEHMLEAGRPAEAEALATRLIRHHVQKALDARRVRGKSEGTLYQPSSRFEVGQKLVFAALDGAEGVVKGVRPGNNPAYGAYDVIEVKLGAEAREFAAGLAQPHALDHVDVDADPDVVAERFGPLLAPQLGAILSADREWIRFGDRWVLRALLPEVNAGHRNLAEAIVMLAGEPMAAEQILEELDLDASVPVETRALALELALSEDERFRNVGALESPLWTLRSQA